MINIINKHDRDDNLRFNEAIHTYYCNNKRLKSVTSTVKSLFEKFDEEKAIEFIMKSKKQEDPAYEYYGMTKRDIKMYWEKKRDDGTSLHYSIEQYFNNIPHSDDSKEYRHFQKFLLEHTHLTPYRAEWAVYSEKYNLAGKIDVIFKKENGKYCLIDYKKSNKINKDNNFGKFSIHPNLKHIKDTNFYHYSLQCNLYKFILEQEYGIEVEDMLLLVLHSDFDNYLTYKIDDMQDEIFNLY